LAVFAGLVLAAASGCLAPRQPGPPQPQAPAAGATRATLPNVARDGYEGTFAYTVQPGDTLFSLAQRYGTTVAILVQLNGITDVTDIPVGATLFIPLVTPTPIVTVTPTPGAASVRVDHGPRDSVLVALTFDMGGRVDPALDIMNWLLDNDIPATIFMTGAIIDSPNTDAGRQVLDIVAANPSLFELGNHSYSHPDFTTLSVTEIRDELRETEEAAAAHVPTPLRPLFRPPFGGVDAAVLSAVGAAGYRYTVMWDVDTIDWLPEADGGPTAAEITTKVVNNAQRGSIVLMHLGGYNTLAALPGMVAGLEARGFAFAKVSTLLP
jgi:peptidoglycan/xylan/chitin deacetylase (PgdA/CDA1 family)